MLRRFHFAILGSVSALALTAAPAQAFTPPVMNLGLLKPQGPWKVGTVAARGASYCAMVAKFDKRIVLAFARSPEGWGSLALDFREDFFTPKMEYEVTLRPERGQERVLTARASSGRSVVIQIGRDDALFRELSEDGDMDVGFPTIDASFALRKFSSSFEDLTACARQMAAPADTLDAATEEEMSPPPAPEAPVAPPVPPMPAVKAPDVPHADLAHADEIAALEKAQAQETRSAVDDFSKKDAATGRRIAKVEADREAIGKKIDAAKSEAEIEKLKARLATTEDRLEALRLDRARDAQDLNDRLAQAKAAYDTRVAGLQSERDSLRAQNTGLAEDKKSLEGKLAEGEGLIARLERTVRDLQDRARSAISTPQPETPPGPAPLSAKERAELERYRRDFSALGQEMRPAQPAAAAPAAPAASVQKNAPAASLQKKKTTPKPLDDAPAAPVAQVQAMPIDPVPAQNVEAPEAARIAPDTIIIWDEPMVQEDKAEVEMPAQTAPPVLRQNRARAFLDRVVAYRRAGSQGPFPTLDGKPRPVKTAKKSDPAPVSDTAAGGMTIEALLAAAGVEKAGFAAVTATAGNEIRHWTSGPISGLAEQSATGGRDPRALQKAYLDRYRADCPDKLSVHVDKPEQTAGGTLTVASLSCAMDGNRYSTSVVMLNDGAHLTTLVHTALPAQAARVREAGEKIARVLRAATPAQAGVQIGPAPAAAAFAPARRIAVPPVPTRSITFSYDAPAPGETLETMVVE